MKRTEKLLSGLLMIAMLITSVGLLFASIYASGSGSQSTFGAVLFEKETGIRYNNLTNEFEVFNEAGVSWIASGRYISIDGMVKATNPDSSGNTYALADGNQIYNIMCDIAYTGLLQNEMGEDEIYNDTFDANKITLDVYGVIDGRGFTLKNFKVKTLSIDSNAIGSAIVSKNYGTIRNLNVANADFSESTSGDAAGLICGINVGIIDKCIVYGADLTGTYQANRYTGLYGIAAITSGRISNSVNSASLNNSIYGGYSAGIASVATGASILNNVNNGNITSTGSAAGIAIDSTGVVFVVRGNTNNGVLSAEDSVSGIIDGGEALGSGMDARGNVNNGELICDQKYELYYGDSGGDLPIEIPTYGIKYNATLDIGSGASGGFEIYNADGVSWIGSGAFFDENGQKASSSSGGAVAATGSAYYEIYPGIKVIDFNEKGQNFDAGGTYNKAFNGGSDGSVPSLLAGGVFDGNNNTLKNFPLRQCAASGTPADYYSALFYENRGTVQNLKMVLNSEVKGLTGEKYAGSIAAYLPFGGSANPVSVDNVSVSGTLVFGCDGGYLGGVVGHSESSVFLIKFAVVSLNMSGAYHIGGILGGGMGDIEDSKFTGKITVDGLFPEYAGGLFGYFQQFGNVRRCEVSAVISARYPGWGAGLETGLAYKGQYLKDEDCSPDLTVLTNLDGSNVALRKVGLNVDPSYG